MNATIYLRQIGHFFILRASRVSNISERNTILSNLFEKSVIREAEIRKAEILINNSQFNVETASLNVAVASATPLHKNGSKRPPAFSCYSLCLKPYFISEWAP